MLRINLSKMGLPSKEDNVMKLFFNEPTKHWHFKDIANKAGISDDRANYWLKKFMKEQLIKHMHEKGKMPYFIANFEHLSYINKKKLYGLSLLYDSGLVKKLQELEKAKAIVIFGSFARADWHQKSDVDVFILGDAEDLRFGTTWPGLHREVQVHEFKTKKDIKKIRSGLINNVATGYFIKGSIHDIAEVSA